MPLLSDSDLAELRDAQDQAMTNFCTVFKQEFVRDTTGGGEDVWSPVEGATLIKCRIAPGGASTAGISGATDEGIVGDSEAAFGSLAATLMTEATISERDRVSVYEMDSRGRPVASPTPPTYEISSVRAPISYQTAVRVGMSYIR